MQDNVTQAVDWTRRAESIVNSSEALRMYASCEWEELSQDGQLWMAQIVRLASTTAQSEAVQKLVDALEALRFEARCAEDNPHGTLRMALERADEALAAHRESQP